MLRSTFFVLVLGFTLSAGVVCGSPAQAQSRQTAASAKSVPGSTREASGVVTESDCSGASEQIALKTPSGTLHLRGPAGGGIGLDSSSLLPKDFNACTSLKGLSVSVQYKPDDPPKQGGTIKSLHVLPAEHLNDDENPLSPPQPASTSAPELIPDAKMTAEGKVTDVTCTGNELLARVSTASRVFTLHARDYSRLTYDDDRSAFESRDFPACTQLKGRTASIDFIVVAHKSFDGEVQSVEIEK